MADSSHGSGASEYFVAPPSSAVGRRKSISRKNLSRALSSGLDLSSFDVPADPGTAQQVCAARSALVHAWWSAVANGARTLQSCRREPS